MFCGQSKPSNLSAYFANFVSERLQLLDCGIDFDGAHFSVAVHSFVCDAPARAMLKMSKGTLASMGVRNVTKRENGAIKLHFSPLHLHSAQMQNLLICLTAITI